VIEENGGRGHAAPTPNELGKGQEEEKEDIYELSSWNCMKIRLVETDSMKRL
jgi:hypothetical protein